jgi:hypothetical protein
MAFSPDQIGKIPEYFAAIGRGDQRMVIEELQSSSPQGPGQNDGIESFEDFRFRLDQASGMPPKSVFNLGVSSGMPPPDAAEMAQFINQENSRKNIAAKTQRDRAVSVMADKAKFMAGTTLNAYPALLFGTLYELPEEMQQEIYEMLDNEGISISEFETAIEQAKLRLPAELKGPPQPPPTPPTPPTPSVDAVQTDLGLLDPDEIADPTAGTGTVDVDETLTRLQEIERDTTLPDTGMDYSQEDAAAILAMYRAGTIDFEEAFIQLEALSDLWDRDSVSQFLQYANIPPEVMEDIPTIGGTPLRPSTVSPPVIEPVGRMSPEARQYTEEEKYDIAMRRNIRSPGRASAAVAAIIRANRDFMFGRFGLDMVGRRIGEMSSVSDYINALAEKGELFGGKVGNTDASWAALIKSAPSGTSLDGLSNEVLTKKIPLESWGNYYEQASTPPAPMAGPEFAYGREKAFVTRTLAMEPTFAKAAVKVRIGVRGGDIRSNTLSALVESAYSKFREEQAYATEKNKMYFPAWWDKHYGKLGLFKK